MAKKNDPTETIVEEVGQQNEGGKTEDGKSSSALPDPSPTPTQMPPQINTTPLPDYISANLRPAPWQTTPDFEHKISEAIKRVAEEKAEDDRLRSLALRNPRSLAHAFVVAMLNGEDGEKMTPFITVADLKSRVADAWDTVKAEAFRGK